MGYVSFREGNCIISVYSNRYSWFQVSGIPDDLRDFSTPILWVENYAFTESPEISDYQISANLMQQSV